MWNRLLLTAMKQWHTGPTEWHTNLLNGTQSLLSGTQGLSQRRCSFDAQGNTAWTVASERFCPANCETQRPHTFEATVNHSGIMRWRTGPLWWINAANWSCGGTQGLVGELMLLTGNAMKSYKCYPNIYEKHMEVRLHIIICFYWDWSNTSSS